MIRESDVSGDAAPAKVGQYHHNRVVNVENSADSCHGRRSVVKSGGHDQD